MEFNSSNRETQRSLTTAISHTFIQNQIINYTSFDAVTGIQHTRPINENGSWNSSGRLLISIPLDSKKKFKFSSTSNVSYSNNVGYMTIDKESGSQKNITRTVSLTQNLNCSYSNDWYYGQLRGNIRYSNTRYSLPGVKGRESYNYGASYNTQITLPLSFVVSSDIAYTGNSGLSAGYNRNEVMWNAEINKQFLYQNRGSLRFRITDILQQRLNIRRSVNGNSIQDSEFTALSSYFIVSFAYRFNNVGGNRGNRGRRVNAEDAGSPDGGEMRSIDRGGFNQGGGQGQGGFGGGRDRNF
jgi:hypothetical protein